jgi:hypothetical protein
MLVASGATTMVAIASRGSILIGYAEEVSSATTIIASIELKTFFFDDLYRSISLPYDAQKSETYRKLRRATAAGNMTKAKNRRRGKVFYPCITREENGILVAKGRFVILPRSW